MRERRIWVKIGIRTRRDESRRHARGVIGEGPHLRHPDFDRVQIGLFGRRGGSPARSGLQVNNGRRASRAGSFAFAFTFTSLKRSFRALSRLCFAMGLFSSPPPSSCSFALTLAPALAFASSFFVSEQRINAPLLRNLAHLARRCHPPASCVLRISHPRPRPHLHLCASPALLSRFLDLPLSRSHRSPSFHRCPLLSTLLALPPRLGYDPQLLRARAVPTTNRRRDPSQRNATQIVTKRKAKSV